MRLIDVFLEYRHQASFYEIQFKILGDSIRYRILWSGYRVQPANCSTHVLSLQGSAPSIGKALTPVATASKFPESCVSWQPIEAGIEDIGVSHSGSTRPGGQIAGYLAAGNHEDVFSCTLPYPDRPL